ncbi:outer membrane beta-barrel protein [Chitinophaga solisilvae]|uniref:outer membrane beta-barrel protein n=1 Tax=Chitinophaga solisilvae TaxID=1233460 RepID=UPI0013698240|nr:outer membrane beta-barrel protein [Chitinophaga solisilvae]
MKKHCLFLYLLLLTAGISRGQQAVIRGQVKDTLNATPMNGAVVMVLRHSDSILVKFTRTGEDGTFHLPKLPAGKFLVMVTFPDYVDYTEVLTLQDSTHINMGNIPLTTRTRMLQEIIVRQRLSPVRMKGDTLEFQADSFPVRPNASVEDLLKELPGIQVDRNGNVTAQGKTIQKILVDGEEFFSEDPSIATKNLRADMIDKVKVFDKKSDQATFTGIDDGVRIKTIDLRLKEEMKKGVFGKIEAGSDFHRYYDNRAMLSAFKGKRKLTVLGTMSNNGNGALKADEAEDFRDGGGIGMEVDNGLGAPGGEVSPGPGGIPITWSGGAHYSNKWHEDRFQLNSNYLFNKTSINPISTTLTQQTVADGVFSTQQQSDGILHTQKHVSGSTIKIATDTLSQLEIRLNGQLNNSDSRNDFSNATTKNSVLTNDGSRTTTNKGSYRAFAADLFWRKRFARQGRSLFLESIVKTGSDKGDGRLYAINNFYKATGTLDKADTTDQQKVNENNGTLIVGKLAYTEPLWKDVYATINYGVAVSKREARRNTFNNPDAHRYIVDSLSSNYALTTVTHRAGAYININKAKADIVIGGDIAEAGYKQRDMVKDSTFNLRFLNFFPRVGMQYKITNFKRLDFTYAGSTQQPSVQQLQPLRDNYDPLNVYVGNAALRPAFVHTFSLRYDGNQIIKRKSLTADLSYSFTKNAIVNHVFIDSTGKSINQPVNLNGNSSFTGDVQFITLPVGTHWGIGSGIKTMFSKSNAVINNQFNYTNILLPSLNFTINYLRENIGSILLSTNIAYNHSTSSINHTYVTQYWIQQYAISAYLFPLKNTFISTETTLSIRQKIDNSDINPKVILWNIFIERSFLDNKLSLRLSVNDVLNQNFGISRSISAGTFSENTYNILRRNWMFRLIWNFSSLGK